ncbi:hypothetical protein POJ06DRAFT_281773 [Lipomyces tetrasporus]|uniref:Alcohol dehydrogenase-like N-terminal domain-containing protein n=1 Tax=Lipomyces tetrasporus TaxID=54092 RepID=A0AAD7VRU4_9ASCO|nr:uncharacterized protein POJ06DRAFT_281773 [Lipomyces tetrasporus]KAJ8099548.1 hypothetical protein POJ06DRAFT_281773 [Lipomyces tetrasporus]
MIGSRERRAVNRRVAAPLTRIALPIRDASELKENQVLIKITATGLAPLDQFRDRGHLNIGSRLPAVIAGDLVGTVAKNGPNATFPIGVHVFSQMLFHLPKANISDAEAALYPINAVPSAMSLFSMSGFGLPRPGPPGSEGFDYASQKVVIVVVRRIVRDDLLYMFDMITLGNLSLGASLLSNSKKWTLVCFWKILSTWLESGKIIPLKYNVIDGLDAKKVNKALDEYGQGRSAERYHVRID